MFNDYSFTLALEPEDPSRTRVTCETSYELRGALSWVVNALIMRRKFAATRAEIPVGLKRTAEARGGDSW